MRVKQIRDCPRFAFHRQKAFAMIHFELDREQSILTITPKGRLEASDFQHLAEEVDPFIEKTGGLKGVMIYTQSFPGWKDFAGLLSHFRFVRSHEQHIARLATVSDSEVLTILPEIARHFIQAEVRHFAFDDEPAARTWLAEA
jgi:hypothetical protein